MASVGWTPKARNDFQAAYLYIARDSSRMAETFAVRVTMAVDQLTRFPLSGRVVPEFHRSVLREFIVQSYPVIYRVRSGDVEILTVLHGARTLRWTDLPSVAQEHG